MTVFFPKLSCELMCYAIFRNMVILNDTDYQKSAKSVRVTYQFVLKFHKKMPLNFHYSFKTIF